MTAGNLRLNERADMRLAMFIHYWLQTGIAWLCVPALRFSGFRFGKTWRSNRWINHVAANLWADGEPVVICRFFNRRI